MKKLLLSLFTLMLLFLPTSPILADTLYIGAEIPVFYTFRDADDGSSLEADGFPIGIILISGLPFFNLGVGLEYYETKINADGDSSSGTYASFGRALGYMNNAIMDVHGAGAQRSNYKINLAAGSGVTSKTVDSVTFYIKGPQGDILRIDNKVRCVRDIN